MTTKFKNSIAAIDRYNRNDPVSCQAEGKSWPQEYLLSLKAAEWVEKMRPGASEELLLAARAHHIGRWEVPREQYPEGKAGYLHWRRDLAGRHAEKAAAIMQEQGYDSTAIERVGQLIKKEQLKKDPDVQLLENALCLAFLQCQYEEFRQKHPHDKVVHILKKTLRKMDEQGRAEALKLHYSEEGLACIREALEQV